MTFILANYLFFVDIHVAVDRKSRATFNHVDSRLREIPERDLIENQTADEGKPLII